MMPDQPILQARNGARQPSWMPTLPLRPPLTASHVGLRIREAYENAGLNRNQLSKRTGIDYGTLIEWERGIVVPRQDSLARVAREVGYSVEDLVGDARILPDPPASPYAHFYEWLESSETARRLQLGEVLGAESDRGVIATLQRERFLGGDAMATVAVFEEMARGLIQQRRGTMPIAPPEPLPRRPRPPGTRPLPRKRKK